MPKIGLVPRQYNGVSIRNKNPHIAIHIKNLAKTPNHIAINVLSPRNISRAINAAARNRRIATMKAPRPPSPNRRSTRKKTPGPSKLRSSSSSRRKL